MRRVVAAFLLAAATLGVWLLAASAASASPVSLVPAVSPVPWPQPSSVAPVTPGETPATPEPSPEPSPGSTPDPSTRSVPESRSPLDRLGDAATGATADLQCKRPPAPGKPVEGLAGWIDGGPAQQGSGLYSRYGYGGWQPVIYDPGCPISVDGLRGAEARIFDGRNETASLYMQVQLAAVALAVEAANIVFAQDGIWALLTPVTAFLRWSIGARWWVLFGGLALAATGVYWLVRARRGDVAEASASSARSAIILAVGGACLATTVTAGALVSQGVSAFYGAMGQATVATATAAGAADALTSPGAQSTQSTPGASSTSGAASTQAPAPGTADAVLGDMLVSNVVYPSWLMLHFGNDHRAAAQFGERLFAAGAMTREEAARAASDPAYASSLTAAKKSDYVQVAREYQAAYPDTYNRYLAGNDTSGRPSAALAGLLGCIPIVVFLVWSLWWMGTLRIVIDLALALAPAGALLAQFPRAQWLATALVKWLTVYLVTAAVATTLFVVLVAGGVGGILGANAATSSKVIAMFVLLVLGRAMWKKRRLITDRTGVSRDSERVAVAMESLRQELQNVRSSRSWQNGAVTGAATGALAGAATGAAVASAAPVVLADAEPRRLARPVDAAPEPAMANSEPVEQPAHVAPVVPVPASRSFGAPAVAPGTTVGLGDSAGDSVGKSAGGAPFDSFDAAARERAARRVEAARAAASGVPVAGSSREQLEHPRRLDPVDWPTDRHDPHVNEVPDSVAPLAVSTASPHRLETPSASDNLAPVPVPARSRQVNAHADASER